MAAAEKTKPSSDDKKGKKDRYCIGRKPVTDFVVGQTYSGTVVYTKPFGVFFDIGCHSDAFCHVSRLSDDYVESPEAAFRKGDKVPRVRIVEIDRKKKRITVSLQSDARLEDERISAEAKKTRTEKNNKAKNKNSAGIMDESPGHKRFETNSESKDEVASSVSKHQAVVTKVPPAMKKDPSSMTPAELKRARKLARRAERRAQAAE